MILGIINLALMQRYHYPRLFQNCMWGNEMKRLDAIIKLTGLVLAISIVALFMPTHNISAEEVQKSRNAKALDKILALEDSDKEVLRMVVLGDSRSFPERFKRIIHLINSLEPDFVLHLGDIVERGGAHEYDEIMPLFDMIKAPLIAVPGNHDCTRGKDGKANFRKYFGETNTTFDLRNYRFIMVDNSHGYLSRNQIGKIRDELEIDKTRFVMMHAPPLGPYQNHIFEGGAKEFVELLISSECEYAVFSHIHGYDYRMIGDKCHAFITGGGGAELNGWGEAKEIHHVMLYELSDTGVEWEMVPLEDQT